MFIAFLFSLSFVDCAKRGSPSGGKRDSLPPIIVKSSPENYSTNFEGDEIRISFDEYIKLVDVQKNLVVSPPLEYQPIITPLTTSKQLRIQIVDTLKENTTYSFNFGKSIVDNNEGNEFPYFKYVFSTGSFIDSLTLSGTVNDALLPKAENPVSVLLYEYNENFSDSLVLQKKPTYITVTQDESNAFEFSNLKEGKYLLVALKEKSNDYIFQPSTDKIGFVRDTITLPTDSTFSVTVFKESPDYEIARPSHQSKNEILFGYQGDASDLQIEPLFELPQEYRSTIFRDISKDTLHYWFEPAFDTEVTDSLLFLAKTKPRTDTVEVRLKNLFADSLKVSMASEGTLTLDDTLRLGANIPIRAVDPEKFTIIDLDSTNVPLRVQLDTVFNRTEILFDASFEQRYTINVLPGAVTDFFGSTNDSLVFRTRTLAEDDYGEINLTLENGKEFPLIIQLVDERFKLIQSKIATENGVVQFRYIVPGFYYIRVIYDSNENGKWDSGNYLRGVQPERVMYYNDATKLEVNGNWDLRETLNLE